jgi:hypothetical protein
LQISVIIGAIFPVIVNHTICPWYLSRWALIRAADSYAAAARLLAQLHQRMVRQLGHGTGLPTPAGTAAAAAAVDAMDKEVVGGAPQGSAQQALHAHVQQPLTDVANALARNATLWHRGLLATPHAVHAMMAACTLLADRLAALQVLFRGH